jgi:hypothetical protein
MALVADIACEIHGCHPARANLAIDLVSSAEGSG